jgi:hypothetical protein
MISYFSRSTPHGSAGAIRLVVVALTFAFLVGCVGVHNTAALRIGMTREEAIAAMGYPASVGAQGNFEYLNYTMSDSNGLGTMMRPYYVRLVDGRVDAFGFSEQINRSPVPSSGSGTIVRTQTPATADGVRILSIEPAALVRGQSQDVAIKLRYSLASSDQATLTVMFNVIGVSAFRPLANETIQRGTGEVTIKTKVTPVDWGEFADFKVNVMLREGTGPPGPGSRSLTAPQQQAIPLKN